jgi:hypothetical protein
MSIRLPQRELHRLFIEDIDDYAKGIENDNRKPMKMYLQFPFNREVKLYIWNCTAPPGGRSEDEYKVQLIIDGQKRGERAHFDESDGSTVLIIGYATPFDDPEDGLWVLFELDKHREFAYSANIQIYLRQLLKGFENDVYVHKKHNKETVVICRRKFLVQGLQKRFDIDYQIMMEKADHGTA